jgi:hypothetical protein
MPCCEYSVACCRKCVEATANSTRRMPRHALHHHHQSRPLNITTISNAGSKPCISNPAPLTGGGHCPAFIPAQRCPVMSSPIANPMIKPLYAPCEENRAAGSSDDEDSDAPSRNRSAVPPKHPRSVFTHKPASAASPATQASASDTSYSYSGETEQAKASWTAWSLWNSVLFQDQDLKQHQEAPSGLQRLEALRTVARAHTTWAVVLSSGGHFAAAVFDMRSGSQQHPEMKTANALHSGAWPVATVHKTIHRYSLVSFLTVAGSCITICCMLSNSGTLSVV